jgi:hypothetical protein
MLPGFPTAEHSAEQHSAEQHSFFITCAVIAAAPGQRWHSLSNRRNCEAVAISGSWHLGFCSNVAAAQQQAVMMPMPLAVWYCGRQYAAAAAVAIKA